MVLDADRKFKALLRRPLGSAPLPAAPPRGLDMQLRMPGGRVDRYTPGRRSRKGRLGGSVANYRKQES